MLKYNLKSMSEKVGLDIDHFLNSSLNADILSKKDLSEEKFRNNNRKIVIIIIIAIFHIEINVSCHTAHIGSVFVSQE